MPHLFYTLASVLIAFANGAIFQKDVNHWIISPKENCKPVCPCIMDGINYKHGDRWQQKGKPCTTYECKNGYYQATYRGCEYKGQCKDSNSIWTEGCFTYKCFTSDIWAYYRLIQGGCADDEGNCWKVGETVNRHCNRYECQIVGSGCYQLKTLYLGCKFEGQCKSFNSYWHNGCSIYQCVNSSNSIGYEKLSNEVMFWPDGNYALLKPKPGCPKDKPIEWEEGNRLHYGNNKSYVSDNFDLFGNYSNLIFDQYFCVHEDKHDLSYIPRYQTYWEPGQYCILRKNGSCPDGFETGYVGLDDVNGLSFMQTLNGSLPDGNYTKDTGFFFCCRHDGYSNAPIVLPKDDAFALFLVNGSNECQEVRGMTNEIQHFAFDDEDFNTEVYQNGSLPFIMRTDNVTIFYYCFYKPLDCGCEDDSGNFLKVGETLTKECTRYKCVEVQGLRYLEIIEGGCRLSNGSCTKENQTWIETSGETCFMRSCLRDTDKAKIEFKIVTDYSGCRDDNKCLTVGSHKKRGCYDVVCVFPSRTRNPRFRMVKSGCSDGRGGCIPLGKTFKKGCLTYRCRREPSKCEMEFVKGACQYNGKCRAINETWTSASCNKLSCSMTYKKAKNSYLFSVDVVEYGCNTNNKCYKVGDNITDGCFTKQCMVHPKEKYVYMGLIGGGCFINGACMDVNSTFEKDCATYQCYWKQNGKRNSFGIEIIKFGCKFGGKCYNEGESVEKNCASYVCNVKVHNDQKYASLDASSRKCKDRNGGCIEVGTEVLDDYCYRRTCSLVDNWPSMVIKTGGCKFKGTCYDANSTWVNKADCATYKCSVTVVRQKYRSSVKIDTIGCSSSGTCRADKEKWTKGCYENQCIVSGSKNKLFARIQSKPRGCVIKGVCRNVGYTAKYQGCHQYKCLYDDKIKQARFAFHTGGCNWKGKCVTEGEVVIERCMAYKCIVSAKNGRVMTSMKYDPSSSKCRTADGNCVSLGETLLDEQSCYYRQCKNRGNRIGFEYVKGGCKVKGICRDAGSNWTSADGCRTYQCEATKSGNHWKSRTNMVDLDCCCSSNKKCRRKNESWIEGCYKKTCIVMKSGSRFSTRISFVPNGCKINGQCRPVGYTETRHGCFKYGCVYSSELQRARFQFLKGGCKDSSAKCHDPGQSWNYKYGSSCFKATCTQRGNRYSPQYARQDKSNCK